MVDELNDMVRHTSANNARMILNDPLTTKNIERLKHLIQMCNYVYNNFPNAEPLIDDSLYDQLMVFAKRNNIDVPIGSPSLETIEYNYHPNSDIIRNSKGLIEVVTKVPDIANRIYYHDMVSNCTNPNSLDFVRNHDSTLVEKKKRATAHTYDLCGTLDKCKYVFTSDANPQDYGNMNIGIFERDFLQYHIDSHIIDPNNIVLIASLKYDGISVENTIVNDTIISSLTRGDLSNNEASDLTPILGGMQFPRAIGQVFNNGNPFGIKFEYIMTDYNKYAIEKTFGKYYVNLRNAVIGVLGGLDARLYRDYLTPVPLESTIYYHDRIQDLHFLNQYFTKGIDCRWSIIQGDYHTVLDLVRTFVKEAESLRDYMGFAYDGIVIEYAHDYIRNRLGKKNSIPQYAIAIKFDPLKKTSIFTHYTYSVGQDGSITPMAHFEPVEFFGAIHNKTTAHSYRRFLSLGLHAGDKVNLTLNNDVIVYIRRAPESEQDPNNPNSLIDFPTHCPSCGTPLVFYTDSVYCPNFQCPERTISRLSNCLAKLGLKDFSTETIKALNIHSIKELYTYPHDKLATILGPVNSQNLINNLENLRTTGLSDYRIIGSIGFSNIAIKTWKTILEVIPIDVILTCDKSEFSRLYSIKGIGPSTVETIINERDFLIDDLNFLFNTFVYIKTPQYDPNREILKVCFTGFRDPTLEEFFTSIGYEIVDSMTKDTNILIVSIPRSNSSKIIKAFKYLSQAYYKLTQKPKTITWDDLEECRNLNLIPMIISRAEVYQIFLKSSL